MGTNNNMDIDLFITEIENRPAIWDMRCELYSNRVEKTKAWEEICILFIPDFEKKTVQEKNTAATQIQRKWKSLRDSYNRERSRQRKLKSGAGASSRKEYMYFQQLSFLSVLAESRPESQDVERDQDPPSPAANISTRKKMKAVSNIEKTELELLNNLNKRMTSQDENDPDRSFLMSLVPEFKGIHEDLKLDLKTELLVLLKKYKNLNQHVRYQPQHGYYGQQSMVPEVYPRLTTVRTPGPLVNETASPIPGPSQDYDRSTCYNIPTSTPSPAASISRLSDSESIIEDMFYEHL